MKIQLLSLLCLGLLSACAGPAAPPPALPEGAPTLEFSYQGESFLRGVTGSSLTVPAGRPSAILNVNYGLSCLADNAQSRLTQSQAALDAAYVVAPLFVINARERRAWRRDAARQTIALGCAVTGVRFETQSDDPLLVGVWALQNRVPPIQR